MYELSHDLAGALSPVIVMLAMMMMTGGSGGSSSYAFSGKADDVGFLLLKARAAARKIPCAHRRSGNGIVLNGGPPISYAAAMLNSLICLPVLLTSPRRSGRT